MKETSWEQKVNDLEKAVKSFKLDMKSCKHEIERLQAVNEIQNLMSKYEYYHMTNMNNEVKEQYAKKAPDVKVLLKIWVSGKVRMPRGEPGRFWTK